MLRALWLWDMNSSLENVLSLLIPKQNRLFLKETSKNTSMFVGEPEELDFGERKCKLKAIKQQVPGVDFGSGAGRG